MYVYRALILGHNITLDWLVCMRVSMLISTKTIRTGKNVILHKDLS